VYSLTIPLSEMWVRSYTEIYKAVFIEVRKSARHSYITRTEKTIEERGVFNEISCCTAVRSFRQSRWVCYSLPAPSLSVLIHEFLEWNSYYAKHFVRVRTLLFE